MAAEFLIQLGIFATRARQVSAIRILYFKAPAFHKLGRAVVYDLADLDAWLASHRVETSEAA